jgi:hypothetical protein
MRAGNFPNDSAQTRSTNLPGICSRDLSGTGVLPDTTSIFGHCRRHEGKGAGYDGDHQEAGFACVHGWHPFE